jgi:hypothetical protein
MLEFMLAHEHVHCCNIAFSCDKVPRRLAEFQRGGK